MASFAQMEKEKILKRADASKVILDEIYIEPGFNLDGRNEGNDEDDESLYQYIMSGGMLPNLEVRPRDEGGVWIVDGHRRYTQLCRAVAAGAPLQDKKDGLVWISVVQFIGNDVARTARLLTSAERKPLTALQIAEAYARLSRFGLSPDDIAREVKKTRQHVDQMLILAHANSDVHQAVKQNLIAPTEAINMVRSHGESAGAEIKRVSEKSGRKVTAKSIKPWSPPKSESCELISALDNFIKTLPEQARIRLASLESAVISGNLPPDQEVNVPASSLLSLLNRHNEIVELRNASEQKAREKALNAS